MSLQLIKIIYRCTIISVITQNLCNSQREVDDPIRAEGIGSHLVCSLSKIRLQIPPEYSGI